MSKELRDHPRIIAFIRGVGYTVDADTLSTVERVAGNHSLTKDEARACLIDLGLIFLTKHPADAHKCMLGLAIHHQGDPKDGE